MKVWYLDGAEGCERCQAHTGYSISSEPERAHEYCDCPVWEEDYDVESWLDGIDADELRQLAEDIFGEDPEESGTEGPDRPIDEPADPSGEDEPPLWPPPPPRPSPSGEALGLSDDDVRGRIAGLDVIAKELICDEVLENHKYTFTTSVTRHLVHRDACAWGTVTLAWAHSEVWKMSPDLLKLARKEGWRAPSGVPWGIHIVGKRGHYLIEYSVTRTVTHHTADRVKVCNGGAIRFKVGTVSGTHAINTHNRVTREIFKKKCAP